MHKFCRAAAQSILLIGFLSSGPAMSQAASPPPLIYADGMGARTCAAYIAPFAGAVSSTPAAEADRLGYSQWVLGYLSAWNFDHGKEFKARYGVFGSEEDRRSGFTENWIYETCAANPNASIVAAANEYILWRLEQEGKPMGRAAAAAPVARKAPVTFSPCVRAKIDQFHKVQGEDEPIPSAAIDEWEQQCATPKKKQ